MNSSDADNKIDVSPTKDLFITMLTKDIDLIDAIVDLVDNSVDGARRLRGEKDYEHLEVRIEMSEEQFTIIDNCGGIPVDVARKYAFRMGRPEGTELTKHSVGRFGIGMKRALFKLGKQFVVESISADSRFVVKVNIDEWKMDPEWRFDFAEVEEDVHTSTERETGTKITVSELYEGVAEQFALTNFQNRFAVELESKHQESMERKLVLLLNNVPLQYRPAQLLQSDVLGPAHWEKVFNEYGDSVAVRLHAGIASSRPASAAGWYVFCNGRMVLEADRSMRTGWGENGTERIPQYHGEFARFRGYAFFDSDDPSLLPWNTTKTDVDADSHIYRAVRQQMMLMTRPVLDFLYKLNDEEKSLEVEPLDSSTTPLFSVVEAAKEVSLSETRKSSSFIKPEAARKSKSAKSTIRYSVPREKVEIVKESLGATTLPEVGQLTFDYYYDLECDDQ